MIISGTELSKNLREEMKNEVLSYKGRLPHLVVILVGDNPASKSYVTGKDKACAQAVFFFTERRVLMKG